MKTKSDVIIKPQEEYAYGHIIKALAGGLYPNKFHVVREYIQNAFDAIIAWKAAKKDKNVGIKITIQKPSIFIFDNGTGMDRHTLNEYRKVGFSKKIAGESAGFRGIGKLAGISVAKKLIITTSPYGTAEKYILTFDAEAMIQEIDALKKKRENISLNALIEKHTNLTSEVADKDEHYTMVELHEIKQDSKILFDKKKLVDYISKNAPVPFDPKFEHGKEIEDDIKKFVSDYDCVDASVDGKNIYKPYSPNLKKFQHILVTDRKDRKKILAYCWYCENKKKGQVSPSEISGLIYRYKNFAVGDNYLTRKTIWDASSHLAFYFMSEVYISDLNIMPTSQRDDFEQSSARDKFYKEADTIANELNKIA
ncbi:MAG: ATP-binding protein, partial [Candidatus Omnitrophica bacterium]|nr:ATP-binding protein [Candidatus Omnitrophota bacterium]